MLGVGSWSGPRGCFRSGRRAQRLGGVRCSCWSCRRRGGKEGAGSFGLLREAFGLGGVGN